ncbi:MAG: SRPBCC domain-containing protein [Anaerolineaceae bacterium]|nr:SRPBCC domain-containing protein [Anaerolineaceae bacterium]
MERIIHVLEIDTNPRQVFLALTLPDKLRQWWTTQVETDTTNAVLRFRFHEDFNPNMRIEEQQQDKEVSWHCVGGHDNWHESTLAFGLQGDDQSTMVIFAQDFAEELDEVVYGRYNFNWGYYLDSLRLFCETGRGKPFQSA